MKRRRFLAASALAVPGGLAGPIQASGQSDGSSGDVTGVLAAFVVGAMPEAVPPAVRREGIRTLLNWVGCALGGSGTEAVRNAVGALAPFFGPAQATLLGRGERPDILHAALLNGISSHILDFDDTHLKTVIHPAGPVASAILALAEHQKVSGRDFLNALILGIEVECRIGNAVYPEHYDTGWHITGTAGVFGAAAASGKLLGLNRQQMAWALGMAAAQPVGLREMFGTMTKSFHPGRAAQNGLTSALLAANGFTSSEHGIEAKSGWANVLSTRRSYDEITAGLGKTFELSLNTYKPFACGIVMHPAIDGCIQLRGQYRIVPALIRAIDLRVHPLVLELTGKQSPASGLEGKFSIYHAVAVALIEGAAGDRQFSDRTVLNPATIAVRKLVTAVVDPAVAQDQVRISVLMQDGQRLEKFVEHAVGSTKKPMSDAELEKKFVGQAEGVMPVAQSLQVMELCRQLESLPDAGLIARSAGSTA